MSKYTKILVAIDLQINIAKHNNNGHNSDDKRCKKQPTSKDSAFPSWV